MTQPRHPEMVFVSHAKTDQDLGNGVVGCLPTAHRIYSLQSRLVVVTRGKVRAGF
jgi:hypothetical protein